MSKIFENKQLIHIASEVVILVALVYYFNQKNRKLLNIVEDLAQRVEEQEDLIQKHEEIIKKMVEQINKLSSISPPQPSYYTPQPLSQPKRTKPPPLQPPQKQSSKKSVRHIEPPVQPPVKQTRSPAQVSFSKPQHTVEETYDNYDDEEENSDLDAELAEELSELDTDDLKKQQ